MAHALDSRLISKPELLDVVDASWAAETLPDDNIPLPTEEAVATDESLDDAPLKPPAESASTKAQRWNDLGLGR
ncbi:hypothetical protein FOA52_002005 [Chlamydomonas sp. UWO 241]|nr:hypothetical protein FOA52_002005 [Chlamydomonas sp. UWO 241]